MKKKENEVLINLLIFENWKKGKVLIDKIIWLCYVKEMVNLL